MGSLTTRVLGEEQIAALSAVFGDLNLAMVIGVTAEGDAVEFIRPDPNDAGSVVEGIEEDVVQATLFLTPGYVPDESGIHVFAAIPCAARYCNRTCTLRPGRHYHQAQRSGTSVCRDACIGGACT